MIRIEETVHVRRSASEAFAFLADFRNLPTWDPGIAEAQKTDGRDEVAPGSRFYVVADFMGRKVPMKYRMTKYDTTRREAELVGETATVKATDRISVREIDGGTEVHWQADFELKGPLRFGEKLMKPLFERLGRKAMAGLRATL